MATLAELRQRPYALTPQSVTEAYQAAFGRTPTEQDIAVHVANPGGWTGFLDTLEGSDEFKNRPAATGGSLGELGRQGITDPNAWRQHAGPNGLYTGFDASKESGYGREFGYDLGRSAKGLFATTSTKPALEDQRWRDPATSPDWFNQYLRPHFEANGFEILKVDRDKILVKTAEGTHWVDWVVNQGGANPQLGWQAQTESGGRLHAGPGGGLEPNTIAWRGYTAPPPGQGGAPPPSAPPPATTPPPGSDPLVSDESLYALGLRRPARMV